LKEELFNFPKIKFIKLFQNFKVILLTSICHLKENTSKKGEKLFSFYSPDILRIKNEFLITKDSIAIEKLKFLNLKIEDIFDDSVIFRSPIKGDIIMEIVDNNQVLFIGDLRKSEANEIKIGDIIQAKNKKGYIREILPSSDGNFIKVLAVFDNDEEFFENNYEIGKILKPIKGIIIPKDAVIRTGNKDIVYLYENGNFKKMDIW